MKVIVGLTKNIEHKKGESIKNQIFSYTFNKFDEKKFSELIKLYRKKIDIFVGKIKDKDDFAILTDLYGLKEVRYGGCSITGATLNRVGNKFNLLDIANLQLIRQIKRTLKIYRK